MHPHLDPKRQVPHSPHLTDEETVPHGTQALNEHTRGSREVPGGESCHRARARDPSGPPSSLRSSPALLPYIPAMGGSLPHKGLAPSSGTDEPQNCLLLRWAPLCLLKGKHLLSRPLTPALSTRTHTHTHTRRCGSVKVPAACRAWPGAETHRKGQGSSPAPCTWGFWPLLDAARPPPYSAGRISRIPGLFLWQQQNTPSRF